MKKSSAHFDKDIRQLLFDFFAGGSSEALSRKAILC